MKIVVELERCFLISKHLCHKEIKFNAGFGEQVPRECLKPSLESKTLGQGNSSEANVVNASETSTSNCPHPITLSWDGSIEIQSGDVLLVRIDDSTLIHQQAIILDSTNDTDHSVDR